jgi:tetratricopeptide (TPR) repeat protein
LLLFLPGGDKPKAQVQDGDSDILFTRALEAENAELWEQAIELYSQGKKLYPREPRFPLALGTLYYYRGLYGLAWDEYRKTEEILPGNPELLYLLSRCAGYLNQDRVSVDYLERLLLIDPSHKEAIGNLGWMYYKVHRLGEGERLLLSAVEQFGEDSDFAMTLGTLYSDMFRYEEGKQWYQRAIAGGEQQRDRVFTAVAHYNLSILETRFNYYDRALEEANASLDSQNRASGRLARGELFLRRLDFPRAMADYETAYDIDTSPLSKVNLAQIYQISGRLEEARLYAEDCLKTGDLSWMLNYGIDPVRYQRDIREILYKTYSGLAKTEALKPWGSLKEKTLSLFRFFSYRFKTAVNRRLYQKYSLLSGNAYGTEVYQGGGPHLDAYIQYYNAFESYPRRALTYLNQAREFETSLIPAVTPSYDLEEGILLGNKDRVKTALRGFDPAWERDFISKCYAELSKQEKGRARREAAERLYALNRGYVRQQGISLPVELFIRFARGPENGGGANLRVEKTLAGAVKKAGFDTVKGNETGARFTLTIVLSGAGAAGGTPGAALSGNVELYDREKRAGVIQRTLPVRSLSRADIYTFVRNIGDAVFTAE